MAGKLAGKVAAVTGGGGGIGGGISSGLAAEGAKVVVNDLGRNADGASAADIKVQEIKKAGGEAAASYDSVSSMAGGESIISTAISKFGRIDIVVNCAANYAIKSAIEMTEKDWDSILAVHLKGHFAVAKAAMPHMVAQKSGRIINFSSRGAFVRGGNLAYATSKAGIMGFTSFLSEELKPYNITVNAIMPSAVTQLFQHKGRDARDDGMPVPPRMGGDYVAPMVVYLCTDAAQNITGRYIYAAAGDFCLYVHPLRMSSANVFVRKPEGKWTVDELGEMVPGLLGLD
ncbi:MAG: SDR family NAD(P)-dependent oxidoreductase [Chloroflexi bacterium]|nr:SDR family NAD(P)-dependent oxidoreductase [Chloroflexota bacterium]